MFAEAIFFSKGASAFGLDGFTSYEFAYEANFCRGATLYGCLNVFFRYGEESYFF